MCSNVKRRGLWTAFLNHRMLLEKVASPSLCVSCCVCRVDGMPEERRRRSLVLVGGVDGDQSILMQ